MNPSSRGDTRWFCSPLEPRKCSGSRTVIAHRIAVKNILRRPGYSWLVHMLGDSAMVELENPNRLFTVERELRAVCMRLLFRRVTAEVERFRRR